MNKIHSISPRFVRQRPEHENIHWENGTAIIWHPDEVETHYEQPRNSFCRFRHTFELQAQVHGTEFRIFADSRYMLFVNGSYVGRGPGRSDPRWQYYDILDVSTLLVAGRNTIAVLALHYGYGTGQSMHRIPALLAECAIDLCDGSRLVVSSNGEWKCALHPAYDRSAPRINGCQGPIEIFDTRKSDTGWTEGDYDDSGWVNAKARGRNLSPFWNLVPREIPLLEEGERTAITVVGKGDLIERTEPVERLHKQIMAEEAGLAVTNQGSSIPAAEYTVSKTERGKALVVTFDFGRLEVGYLQLEVTGTSGDILDVVYAEELWEGKALLNANNNRSTDRFILDNGLNRLEVAFGWKGFRYVQIRVRNHTGEVTFHRVGLRTKYYLVKSHSSFTSSDAAMDQLWSVSAHTLRCSMQDGFLDSSSREQQQWMGDGRVQAVYNYYYSGDSRMHAKLLKQFGQSQDWVGMTTSRYPDDHHNYPPIPSFCLHWVASFEEYQFYTGDDSLVAEWWPNIVQAIRWFTAYLNKDGLLENVPYWPFIDWGELPNGPAPDVGRGGMITALNLQYLETVRVAERFARQLRDTEAEAVFRGMAERLAEAIQTWLWNEEAGAYTECVVQGHMSEKLSEIANCLALLHLHETNDARAIRIIRGIFAEPAGGTVIKASPYFMLYVYRALDKHGYGSLVLQMIRERYGVMLAAGATTLWENWELFYKTNTGGVGFQSASHAWASMPLVFAAEQFLGVRPTAAGFKQVIIAPRLYDLKHAEGSVVTPAGEYRVAVKLEGNKLRVETTIPAGCEAWIGETLYSAGEHNILV